MKILIVSDTHCDIGNFKKVIVQVPKVDLLIHCGDVEGYEEHIKELAGCRMEMVAGNNDYFSNLLREKEFNIGKYKVWLTHGHQYSVSFERETIKREAKERGVNIVMYGHSHKPIIDITPDIIAINPGSLTYPRQEGKKPSYILMELDAKGEAHFTINYL